LVIHKSVRRILIRLIGIVVSRLEIIVYADQSEKRILYINFDGIYYSLTHHSQKAIKKFTIITIINQDCCFKY